MCFFPSAAVVAYSFGSQIIAEDSLHANNTQTNKFQIKRSNSRSPSSFLPIDFVCVCVVKNWSDLFITMAEKKPEHDGRLFSKRLYIYAWVSQLFVLLL